MYDYKAYNQRRLAHDLHSAAVNTRAALNTDDGRSDRLNTIAVYFSGSMLVLLMLVLLPTDTSAFGDERSVLSRISSAAMARPLVRCVALNCFLSSPSLSLPPRRVFGGRSGSAR